ncbi:MAG: ABC-2 transporter permease [Peptostreptococcaceae bacterium]|nr:ABC-2 transporter permease [Peptostreptococcaceae bacterium]
MKGLITKDLLTIASHKMYFIMIAIFVLIPDQFLGNFAIVFAAMLPITAIAYDERSKWQELESMMPYSNKDKILSKYLLAYMLVFAVLVLSIVVHSILALFISEYKELVNVSLMAIVVSVALIIIAINLPFIFKLGVEKGRFVFIGLSVLIVMLGTNLNSFSDVIKIGNNVQYYLFIIAAIINIASIMISYKINYKKCRN